MKIDKEEVFKILGHITVYFSTLDVLTTSLIFYLVTDEYKESRKPLSDSMTLANKFRFLQSLKNDDVKNLDVLNRVMGFLDEAILIAQERNRFMHDQWEFKDDNLNNGIIKLYKITGLKDWKWKTEDGVEYNIKKLQDLLSRIGNIQGKVGAEHRLLQ